VTKLCTKKGCNNVPFDNRLQCESCLAPDRGYKAKSRTKLKEAETANTTAAQKESEVRRWLTPGNMRIFEILLGLTGRGVVRIRTDGELMTMPESVRSNRGFHISPATFSINYCVSHVHGTALDVRRSRGRREGRCEIKTLSVLKVIGYAVMASIPSRRLWCFVVIEINPVYKGSSPPPYRLYFADYRGPRLCSNGAQCFLLPFLLSALNGEYKDFLTSLIGSDAQQRCAAPLPCDRLISSLPIRMTCDSSEEYPLRPARAILCSFRTGAALFFRAEPMPFITVNLKE
jgi:hypothetical protein